MDAAVRWIDRAAAVRDFVSSSASLICCLSSKLSFLSKSAKLYDGSIRVGWRWACAHAHMGVVNTSNPRAMRLNVIGRVHCFLDLEDAVEVDQRETGHQDSRYWQYHCGERHVVKECCISAV